MLSNFATIVSILTAVSAAPLAKRGSNTCSFPTNEGLVAVTPKSQNGGWAMSPDQQCTPGNYCPYACPPGKVMAQWDPSATSYTYPQSQNGGLYCNKDGTVSKPFPNSDYCVDGEGSVSVNNKAKQEVAFCQTVLPGNEAMLIPTGIDAGSTEVIAVPGPNYWAGTAAHFYVNAPGISTSDACVWGSQDKAQGNWSPYVAGTNTDSKGNTYVKIGWNPIYVDAFANQKPSFGIRVVCDNESDCNGLQCEIDPSKTGFNGVSRSPASKADGASYCVVTAENSASAKIEVFSV